MKRLLLGFIVLFIAVWIGFLIHKDSGYVLLNYAGWSVETSLWVAIVVALLAFTIIHFLLRLLRHTQLLGGRLQKWGLNRRSQKSRKQTHAGLCELAEGNWQKAENILVKSAQESFMPLINYLSAARAAQAQMAFDRRDSYLRKAHKANPKAEVAIGLTQAQLQINGEQWEQALATLKHLNQLAPNHKYILKLLHLVYMELKDWQQLHVILPKLRKYKILSTQELDNLAQHVYLSQLQKAALTQDTEKLINTWENIPKAVKTNTKLIYYYTKNLIQQNQSALAIPIIESALKKNWNLNLVKLYGPAKSDKGAKRLATAEKWLTQHPNEPELLLCLGHLASREKFYGKAKSYLESSIAIKPSVDAYHQLGHVYEELGEKDKALENYHKSLA